MKKLFRSFQPFRCASSSRRFFSTTPNKPQHVGIVAMEGYFPRSYVNQTELEMFDKAGKGKYTIGLGQRNMAFTDDREDINSMALTVVQSLLEKYNINPRDVGRLEVGTETIIDKSKATKTTLMKLFEPVNNHNIEGIDTHNACYGGTNALFNALHWVYSPFWDGRYAIVVAGDIAVYEPGPARPTGGCGVVAMLIGPNAALPIEPHLRSTHMENVYDFYKPNLESEYPVVDGKLSITCYYRSLDGCYNLYRQKFHQLHNRKFEITDVNSVDYLLFHSPYSKLVFRSLARLYYNDALNSPSTDPKYKALLPFKQLTPADSYTDKELSKVLDVISKPLYDQKTSQSQILSEELGNTYCGSLYFNLLSLLTHKTEKELVNKRLLLFSFGSGLASSMFSIVPRKPSSTTSPSHPTITNIQQQTDILNRLTERIKISPEQYTEALKLREKGHFGSNYTPVGDTAPLFPKTYILQHIDLLKRRTYVRVP